MTEILKMREYETMGGFMRGVRSAMIKVFGHDDYLTLVERGETRTIEERIRAYENVYYNEGYREENGEGYRMGFEIEYPDKIYVYYDIIKKEVK